jgi:hypothetical protein
MAQKQNEEAKIEMFFLVKNGFEAGFYFVGKSFFNF